MPGAWDAADDDSPTDPDRMEVERALDERRRSFMSLLVVLTLMRGL